VYGGFLTYNNVEWLSYRCVLDRFVECVDEERKKHYPQLHDMQRLST
jgi:hypothetical protein